MELQLIQSKIDQIRGNRVMLDSDLAELYQVEARLLNQSVKRNSQRFLFDFMFRLPADEWNEIPNSTQIVMSSRKNRGATEQGVATLSSVLRSDRVIDVNIAIIRAFVLLRLANYRDLKEEIGKLEREMKRKFKDIHKALHHLLNPKSKPVEIGFNQKGRSKL